MDADVGRLHCELARGRTQVFLTSGSWQVARSSEQSLSCCIGEIGQVARTTNPQLNLGPHASIFEGLQTEGGIRIRRAPTDDFGSRSAADYPWTEEDRVKHDSQNACWVHALLSYNVLHLDRVAPCTFWADGRRLGSWKYAAIFQRVHMGSRSTTPLLRNPNGCAPLLTARGSECRFRSLGCGGLGISRQSQAASSVALGLAAPRIRGRSRCGQAFLLWFRNRRSRLRESYCGAA